MAKAALQQWHCTGCQRHIICKPNTLTQLGWRLHGRGPTCPACKEKENGLGPSGFEFDLGETGNAKSL